LTIEVLLPASISAPQIWVPGLPSHSYTSQLPLLPGSPVIASLSSNSLMLSAETEFFLLLYPTPKCARNVLVLDVVFSLTTSSTICASVLVGSSSGHGPIFWTTFQFAVRFQTLVSFLE
jgi:hypothetical protein